MILTITYALMTQNKSDLFLMTQNNLDFFPYYFQFWGFPIKCPTVT